MPCREGWHTALRLNPNCFKVLVAQACCKDVCVCTGMYVYGM